MIMSRKSAPAIAPPGKHHWRLLFQIAVLVAAAFVLWPQFARFRGFSQALRHVDVAWLLAAAAFTCMNYVFAALTYKLLTPKRLRYGRTLLMQVATSFANRLLPAGIGAMSVNERYLEKSGRLSPAQAVSLVTANQLVGFVAYSLIWAVVIVGFRADLPRLHFRAAYAFVIAAAVLLLIFFRLFFGHMFGKITKFAKHTLRALFGLARRPGRLGLAICASAGITLSHAVAFYLSTRAAGLEVSYVHVLLICLGSFAVNAISPTPGGLGALEAAMVASLVSLHVPGPEALVAVLCYRLVTFWLPILPGYALLQVALRRRWL
jgi:glycosyltransferase 2 family protein